MASERRAAELSIIIVNWNSTDVLKKCLDSLQGLSEVTMDVIVADNGSFDGSDKVVVSYTNTKFLQLPENVGFAQANNEAVRLSKAPILLFLNPDTEVVEDAHYRMLEIFRNTANCGVLGCRLLNSDGTLQTSCVTSFPTLANQALDSNFLRRIFPCSKLWGTRALFETEPLPMVDAVSGACLMTERALFERLGGFCTDYFMYTEDVDYCYRVQQSGRSVYFLREAEVVHHGGKSSLLHEDHYSSVEMRKSRLRFFLKNRGKVYSGTYLGTTMLSASIRILTLGAAVTALKIIAVLSGRKDRFGLNSRNRHGINLQKWLTILSWCLRKSTWEAAYGS